MRVGVAAGLATVVSSAAGLPDAWFAALAAIIAMQTTLHSSVRSARSSIISASFGAVVGAAVVSTGIDQAWAVVLVVVITLGLPSLFDAEGIGKQAALVAAVIVLMPMNQSSVVHYSLNRLAQSLIGIVVALAVQLTIFPPRAHRKVVRELAGIYQDLAEVMRRSAVGIGAELDDTAAIHRASIDLQDRLDAVDSLWAEAMAERHADLVIGPDWRTSTRRIWEHCSVLETDVLEAGDSPLLAAVADPARDLSARLAEAMDEVAEHFGSQGATSFDTSAAEAARDVLLHAVQTLEPEMLRWTAHDVLEGLAVVNSLDVVTDRLADLGREGA